MDKRVVKVSCFVFYIGLISLSKECDGWLFPRWGASCFRTPPIGCFPTSQPFTNTGGIAPQDPAATPTTFFLHRKDHPRLVFGVNNVSQVIGDHFNTSRKTVFIIHGYMENPGTNWVRMMLSQLQTRNDANIITVDWRAGAGNMNYYQSVANTRVAGAVLALVLQNLVTIGGDVARFHLIGFSLGAHVAGYAGSRVQGLGRITGLDPAGPAFESTPAEVRLDPSDANLVDVIHTDGAQNVGLGTMQAMGHVDFYPNRGVDQPGCPNSMLDRFTAAFLSTLGNAVACSHFRVLDIFSASINNACALTSLRSETHRIGWSSSNSRAQWQPCQNEESCPWMGYNLNPNAVSLLHQQQEESSNGSLLVAMQTPSTWPYC